MQIDEGQDQQMEIFCDTILALGLIQQLIFSTQRLDNILDIVINQLILNIQVCEVKPGPYVLDHLAVMFKVNIIKPNVKKEEATFRNLKDGDMGAIFSHFKLEVESYENIDSIVEDLEKKMDELFEKVAPKKTKVFTGWEKQPWYNSDIKNQE